MTSLPTCCLPLLVLLIHLSLPSVEAGVWTVDCTVLTTQRMDPIVYPGMEPEGHVHAIVGGSKFDESAQYDDLQQSQCTTCNVAKDKSNYWVPQLYVQKQRDGKFYHVDMDFHIYYKLINDKGQSDFINNPLQPGEMNAFPSGFQVLAGAPGATEANPNIRHKCMGPGSDTLGFPDHPEECWAIRAEIHFPSCWNGDDGTGGDHSYHMSYPTTGSWMGGPCPSSHPKRLPTLFFEAIYLTGDTFEAGDKLVYSYNDWTGYGFHGDFLNGWDDGEIDRMIEYCRTHEDGGQADVQCGNDKGGPTNCPWEGSLDDSKYKGVLDNLPECSGPCGPY